MSLPRGRRPPLTSAGPSFHLVLAYLIAGSAVFLYVFSAPTLSCLVLWLLWVGALGTLFHRPLAHAFGPIFRYDAIRTARRGSLTVFRCLYALILFVVLYIYFYAWASRYGASWIDVFHGAQLPIGVVSDFNNSFFLTFLAVQFVAVILVTPVYAAGVVTEEKERKTLEYILATDVDDVEFVLGKLVSRLSAMTLLLLSGVPILALLQLLGGVDPTFLMAGFAATFMTMLTSASLSMALSVRAQRTIDAVFGAYFYSAIFMFGTLVCVPSGANFGNPLALWGFIYAEGSFGKSELDILLEHLGSFCLLHLAFTILLCRWAVSQLRSAVLEPARSVKPAKQREAVPVRERPPIGDRPWLWKEIHADVRLGNWGVRLGGLAVIVYALNMIQPGSDSSLVLRPIATSLLMVLMLVIGMVAASKISGEREGSTLDGLLTVPVSTQELLFAKLLGSVAAGRAIVFALLAILGLGVVTRSLHPVGLALGLFQLAAVSSFFAILGLYFSQTSGTTVRATIRVLIVLLLVSVGPWITATWLTAFLRGVVPDSNIYTAFTEYLISPWESFYELLFCRFPALSIDDPLGVPTLRGRRGISYDPLAPTRFWGAFCSPSLYTILAMGIWARLRHRFDKENHRLPLAARTEL